MQIKVLKEGTQRPFLLLYVFFFSIQLLHRNANAMVRRLFLQYIFPSFQRITLGKMSMFFTTIFTFPAIT